MFRAVTLFFLAVGLGGQSICCAESVLPTVSAQGSYLVVVSAETAAEPSWQAVVEALRETYDAGLVTYPSGSPELVLPVLKHYHPRFTAFVARPEESGRAFVVALHRLTRQLDDDPYTDTRWGIITGYEAQDALRMVKRDTPLVINSAASSMGGGVFKHLDHGFASFETEPTRFMIKAPGGNSKMLTVDPDPVANLVDAFNRQSPDLFVTSGHATEHDWQVIFNQHKGSFRHRDGKLYGLNSRNESFDINSPGAKIYMPLGNCLIGHIPERDCMATAWMHSGGVLQMFGYTVVTFHGYMGWGTGSYFNNQYSLAESFYFNNQSLIWALQRDFPEKANVNFERFDRFAIQRMAHAHGIGDKTLLGHLWDRDTVAFYGDPAWVARHRLNAPAWRAEWDIEGEVVTLSIHVLKDGQWWNRPVAVPFPSRLERIRGVASDGVSLPLVTDDFALLALKGERSEGDLIRVTFGAHRAEQVSTSASADPISVTNEKLIVPDAHAERVSLDAEPFCFGTLALSHGERRQLMLALQVAGTNATTLTDAIKRLDRDARTDAAFLIGNMPPRDLRMLHTDYLVENVEYARRGLADVAWRDQLHADLYQDYILPYANLSERRERWRPVLYEKTRQLVSECQRPGEAAIVLNQSIFDVFGVRYHATKRARPDQGPLESIASGYASCTGLAILLVNACRSVGIPARIAGVAQWTNGPGNHTWVEVWDDGWHCIGASESKALDQVWFGKGAAAADESDPFKRVYAARFRRGTLYFPMAWDPYANYVPAEDVTHWYKLAFGN